LIFFSRISPYISFRQPTPYCTGSMDLSVQERDRVERRSFDAVLDISVMNSLGNVSNIWRFIPRTVHACLSVSSFPGGMSNSRIPSLAVTGCTRLRSAAHARRALYDLPWALEGPSPSRFPSHPPPQPQRHLPSYITLFHVIAVLCILLLNVLIPLFPRARFAKRGKREDVLGTRGREMNALW